MLADCLAGDGRFGISLVDPGSDPDAAPQPGDAGVCGACAKLPAVAGRPVEHHDPSRRYPYTLSQYVAYPDLPYRIARVELFDDDAEPGTDCRS